jgi:hypothetical protein
MIGRVSESLRNLLEGEMASGAHVTLLSPADTSTHQTRVNLFLFRVAPNAHLRNLEWLPKPGESNRIVPPPLALNLHYLLTPYAPVDPQVGQADAQAVLAEAMRVLHDHALLPADYLEEGLRPGEVKVVLHGGDVDELATIWTALNADYRLSAVLEVAYAAVPSAREAPLPRRVEEIALGVVPSDRRPSLTGIDPRAGVAGSSLTVHGTDLRGWAASVRIGDDVAALDVTLDDDAAFAVTVPADLAPGIYIVTVDVGGLARLRRPFEVTE